MKYKYKYIAVDFDRTLCTTAFPKCGEQRLIHKCVLWFVKYHQKKGSTVILNTLRHGNPLTLAEKWCKINNFKPDYVNENPIELVEQWGDTRKIACTINIDDTNIGLIGWLLRNTK